MDDARNPTGPSWSAAPSAKSRNNIQRSVTALLDELAPERVLTRVDKIRGPVEQHRTPTGCVLQAATAALSVSWFAEAGGDALQGELHVVVWRGTVTRRGGAPSRKSASVVSELVLRPIEPAVNESIWRAADGTTYDTASLTARCLSLLEEQMKVE